MINNSYKVRNIYQQHFSSSTSGVPGRKRCTVPLQQKTKWALWCRYISNQLAVCPSKSRDLKINSHFYYQNQMCVKNTRGFKSHPRQRLLPLMSVHFDQSLWLSSATTGCHGVSNHSAGLICFCCLLSKGKMKPKPCMQNQKCHSLRFKLIWTL